MKVALVFVLLFAAVLCRPVRRVCQIKSEFLPLLPLTALLPRLSLQETDEEEEEDSSDSSESGESSTPAPATIVPVVVTETPAPEPTDDTIVATIVTDTARGDNLGGHPSEYKSIVYVEEKSYHKAPGPYKSYEFVDTGKKTAYAMTDGNEVEKLPKVYKVQLLMLLHDELLIHGAKITCRQILASIVEGDSAATPKQENECTQELKWDSEGGGTLRSVVAAPRGEKNHKRKL
uniref:Secreted phosphoprotein 1 n=1 Tax=Amphilophus citrinellus TaxID=61819 RepID=A0A3Q0RP49_AMPCI